MHACVHTGDEKDLASVLGECTPAEKPGTNAKDSPSQDDTTLILSGTPSDSVSAYEKAAAEETLAFLNSLKAKKPSCTSVDDFTQLLRERMKQYLSMRIDSGETVHQLIPTPLMIWLQELPGNATPLGLEYHARMPRAMHRKAQHVFTVLLAAKEDKVKVDWVAKTRQKIVTGIAMRTRPSLVKGKTFPEEELTSEERDEIDSLLSAWQERLNVTATTKWVHTMHTSGVDVNTCAEMLYAVFTYTVDQESCDCTSFSECEAKPPDHFKNKPPPPTNWPAHGGNPAPWAVCNWAFRVAFDARQTEETRATAKETIALMKPFWEACNNGLRVLPQIRQVVFRGVGVQLADHYTSTKIVSFPPFTSTSRNGMVALDYMQSNAIASRRGTFFMLQTQSTCPIDFISWYPEELEALLPLFSTFNLRGKMSRSVLRMLNCEFDIVTLKEHGERLDQSLSDSEAVRDLERATHHTLFIFHKYLSTYVEARVAAKPPPASNSSLLNGEISALLNGNHTALMLLGEGGTGKTSAILAQYCRLSTAAPLIGGKRVLPVFISLPTVEGLLEDSAQDQHPLDVAVMRATGLNETQLRHLMESRSVVLLLESLDEVQSSDGKASALLSSQGLLGSNPLCSLATRVLCTSRTSFLSRLGVMPSAVLQHNGRNARVLFLQPFTEADSSEMVRLSSVALAPDHRARVQKSIGSASERIRSHPVMIRMALQVLSLRLKQASNPEDALQEISRVEASSFKDEQDGLSKAVGAVVGWVVNCIELISGQPFRSGKANVASRTRSVCKEEELEMHNEAALYQAFIDGKTEDSSDVREALQRISLQMLSSNRWQMSVREMRDICGEDLWERSKNSLPLRAESLHRDEDAVSLWHKSVGEFACSRAFAVAPAEALQRVKRPFSLNTPEVLHFFAELFELSPAVCHDAVATVLRPMLTKAAEEHEVSNSLAMMTAIPQCEYCNVVVEPGTVIRDCNLQGARLRGWSLAGTSLVGCDLSYIALAGANVDGITVKECTCELPSPPFPMKGKNHYSAAYDREGRRVVVGGSQGRVLLVDPTEREPRDFLLPIAGKEKDWESVVTLVAFIADEQQILAVSSSIWIVDIASGEMKKLELHGIDVTDLWRRKCAYHAKTNMLAIGSKVREGASPTDMTLVDVTSGQARVLVGGGEVFFSFPGPVAFSAHGGHLVQGLNFHVLVWDLARSIVVNTKDFPEYVDAVAMNPDGKMIAIGGNHGAVTLWDVEQDVVRSFDPLVGTVAGLSFNSDGSRLVACASNMLCWFETEDGVRHPIDGHSDEVAACSFSPDGSRILSVQKQMMFQWQVQEGLHRLRSGEADSMGGLSKDEEEILSADVLFSVRTGARRTISEMAGKQTVFDETGAKVLTVNSSSALILHLDSGEERVYNFPSSGKFFSLHSPHFSGDGRHFAVFNKMMVQDWGGLFSSSCHFGFEFYWCDVQSGEYRVFDISNTINISATVSRSENLMVIGEPGSAENLAGVRLIHVDSGEYREWPLSGEYREWGDSEEYSKNIENEAKSFVSLSPDGQMLATGYIDRLGLWDVQSGNLIWSERQVDDVRAACFSPDGQSIVAGAGEWLVVYRVDGTDAVAGARARKIGRHWGGVKQIMFNQAGTCVLSAGGDNTIRRWDFHGGGAALQTARSSSLPENSVEYQVRYLPPYAYPGRLFCADIGVWWYQVVLGASVRRTDVSDIQGNVRECGHPGLKWFLSGMPAAEAAEDAEKDDNGDAKK